MKINDISPKINQASLTNKDNTDFGFKDIVKDLKKAKQQENNEQLPQVEKRPEQVWLLSASQMPINNVRVKKESGFDDIIKEEVNLYSGDIGSFINEITEDETGESINIEDLEFCLDLFIALSGRDVESVHIAHDTQTRQGSPL